MIPRLATPADAPELVRVVNLAYQVEADMFHGERTSEDDVCARLASPNAVFLAIDEPGAAPGRLIGAVYVESHGMRGYFAMLSVDPAYQGGGLGKALVRAAEDHLIRIDQHAPFVGFCEIGDIGSIGVMSSSTRLGSTHTERGWNWS